LDEISAEKERPKSYLEKVREKHARSHSKWTTEEEGVLKKELVSGSSVQEIAEKLGRTKSAITCRIDKLNLQPDLFPKAESQKNGLLQKTMTCLAVSRKYKGYCLAGKEMIEGGKLSWIRPVSSKKMGELPTEFMKLKDGNKPSLLDVICLPVKKHFPHYYQMENYLTDWSKPWYKVGQLQIEKLANFCDSVDVLWENGYHSAKGKNDKIPVELANERCESSLALIQPQKFDLLLSSGLTFKQSIRAEFVYKGYTYNLAVTDIFVEKEYADQPEGRYAIRNKNIYLCVSLGEPLEGFCYKLVAGVIGLKG
jgi:hypothetical protein